METSSKVNALKVDDQDFLVASTIDRCPKVMMIRELFKNSVEASLQSLNESPSIIFGMTIFGETPKLTVWNNGPGMDEFELVRMTNLAASIRKTKGLDDNFGMGAKVASLPSNKEGLRYRSCKNGTVHEVILAYRSGVYGRINRYDEYYNEIGDVIDVTEDVIEENKYDISNDWTEVVLLGNEPEQNTVTDPYNGNPIQEKQWLATYLYHRFYHLPENLAIENRPEWFLDLIHSFAPTSSDSNDSIRNNLQDMLNKLRVQTKSPRLHTDGIIQLAPGKGNATQTLSQGKGQKKHDGSKETHIDFTVTSHGSKMASMMKNLERAPNLIRLENDDQVEEKKLKGRAGRYYQNTGDLFLNMKYPVIDEMFSRLVLDYSATPDPEVMQLMAKELARDTMVQRVGFAVVFALAKRLNKEWDDEALDKALQPESITLAADNYFESLQNSRRKIGTTLKLSRNE